MKQFFRTVAAMAATVVIAALVPSSGGQEQAILKEAGQLLQARHYHPHVINDDFSMLVWQEYLRQLDADKRIFLKEDSIALAVYRNNLDDEIRGDKPMLFYTTALQLFLQRQEEILKEYREILSKPMNFDGRDAWEHPAAYAVDIKTRSTYSNAYVRSLVLRNLVLLQEKRDKGYDSLKELPGSQLEQMARQKTALQLKRYADAMQAILKPEQQFNAYMNVVMHSMDPHTDYFPPSASQSFYNDLRNRFTGIGVQLKQQDGITEIVALEPGGPAWKCGLLQPGDQLLQIGEGAAGGFEDIDGMQQGEVSRLIRGEKGTALRLMVRKPTGALVTVPLIRDEIVQEEGFVKSAVIRHGNKLTGYIALPKFYTDASGNTDVHCAEDVAIAIRSLQEARVNGIVMDLRGNGGGSLVEVIRMLGLFIKEGPVVQVKDNSGKVTVLKDRDSSILYNGPLVVMVNELSASAAEIFSAAIQDYRRGIIIGSTTYGKGTVQSNFPLENPGNGSIKLTYQQFYRVNGISTQLKGVVPDIILPDSYSYLKVREGDQATALAWDQVVPAVFEPWQVPLVPAKVADTTFKEIDRLAAWLAAHPVTTLNKQEYTKQQMARQQAQAALQRLLQSGPGHTLQVSTGRDSLTLAGKAWLEKLKTDIYVAAAVNTITN